MKQLVAVEQRPQGRAAVRGPMQRREQAVAPVRIVRELRERRGQRQVLDLPARAAAARERAQEPEGPGLLPRPLHQVQAEPPQLRVDAVTPQQLAQPLPRALQLGLHRPRDRSPRRRKAALAEEVLTLQRRRRGQQARQRLRLGADGARLGRRRDRARRR